MFELLFQFHNITDQAIVRLLEDETLWIRLVLQHVSNLVYLENPTTPTVGGELLQLWCGIVLFLSSCPMTSRDGGEREPEREHGCERERERGREKPLVNVNGVGIVASRCKVYLQPRSVARKG